jgi:hypothetical protein
VHAGSPGRVADSVRSARSALAQGLGGDGNDVSGDGILHSPKLPALRGEELRRGTPGDCLAFVAGPQSVGCGGLHR